MIHDAIKILGEMKDLSPVLMKAVMEEILTGHADTGGIIKFLTGLSNKGENVEEISAAVEVMRRHLTKIYSKSKVILDTCGTGGDRKGTFNISTIVAFVASGCGITVAKHGNRSVSSKCGSADMLEAIGININLGSQRLAQCLEETGIVFLFAQNLHPAMKYAMPARKKIARRTIFNILGPLSNPALATHQLVGVFDGHWTEVIAKVLSNLGAVHALVVYGEDGLDEITTTTSTLVSETYKGKINNYRINPLELGFKKAGHKAITGGTIKENVRILFDVLEGNPGPKRDIVVLNAAAAIYAADKVSSIKEGISLAAESIDSGRALEKLGLLKEFSQKVDG